VLIDIAGYKGVDMLGDSYEITVDDVQGALKKQNLTLKAGDALKIPKRKTWPEYGPN